MKDNIDIDKIIDDLTKNSSEEDLRKLKKALNNDDRKSGGMDMDFQNMASGFAENIKQRMGLTKEKISVFARDVVRDMILQYDPFIPEEKVQKLLEMFVPEKIDVWKKLPRDVLMSMITQFVAFGEGRLTKEELKDYPGGWYEKYWAFFPPDLQKTIRSYLKGNITRTDFWKHVELFFPL
jgi:hypothetical protein